MQSSFTVAAFVLLFNNSSTAPEATCHYIICIQVKAEEQWLTGRSCAWTKQHEKVCSFSVPIRQAEWPTPTLVLMKCCSVCIYCMRILWPSDKIITQLWALYCSKGLQVNCCMFDDETGKEKIQEKFYQSKKLGRKIFFYTRECDRSLLIWESHLIANNHNLIVPFLLFKNWKYFFFFFYKMLITM